MRRPPFSLVASSSLGPARESWRLSLRATERVCARLSLRRARAASTFPERTSARPSRRGVLSSALGCDMTTSIPRSWSVLSCVGSAGFRAGWCRGAFIARGGGGGGTHIACAGGGHIDCNGGAHIACSGDIHIACGGGVGISCGGGAHIACSGRDVPSINSGVSVGFAVSSDHGVASWAAGASSSCSCCGVLLGPAFGGATTHGRSGLASGRGGRASSGCGSVSIGRVMGGGASTLGM